MSKAAAVRKTPTIASRVALANARIEKASKSPAVAPYLPAIAAGEQRFDSTKVAISDGQLVNLEFQETMAVAHDATSTPTRSNPLGTILYSFFYHSGITRETAMDDGRVSPSMSFLLLAIRPVKGNLANRKVTETQMACTFCGKAWPVGKQLTIKEHDQHLALHGLTPPNG
jgi:hypothetical protein